MGETSERQERPVLRGLALLLVCVVGIGFIILVWGSSLRDQLLSIGDVGAAAPFLYAIVYAVATVLFVPGSVLTIVAGALFGPIIGSLVVFFGASIGASAAFLITRSALRHRIEDRLRTIPVLEALDQAVADDGLMTSILVRLSPLIPFNLLNYALGGTSMRFTHFLLGLFAMLPAIVLYVYLGALASDLADRDTRKTLLTVIGIIATFAVVIRIQKGAKERLNQVLSEEDA